MNTEAGLGTLSTEYITTNASLILQESFNRQFFFHGISVVWKYHQHVTDSFSHQQLNSWIHSFRLTSCETEFSSVWQDETLLAKANYLSKKRIVFTWITHKCSITGGVLLKKHILLPYFACEESCVGITYMFRMNLKLIRKI